MAATPPCASGRVRARLANISAFYDLIQSIPKSSFGLVSPAVDGMIRSCPRHFYCIPVQRPYGLRTCNRYALRAKKLFECPAQLPRLSLCARRRAPFSSYYPEEARRGRGAALLNLYMVHSR